MERYRMLVAGLRSVADIHIAPNDGDFPRRARRNAQYRLAITIAILTHALHSNYAPPDFGSLRRRSVMSAAEDSTMAALCCQPISQPPRKHGRWNGPRCYSEKWQNRECRLLLKLRVQKLTQPEGHGIGDFAPWFGDRHQGRQDCLYRDISHCGTSYQNN